MMDSHLTVTLPGDIRMQFCLIPRNATCAGIDDFLMGSRESKEEQPTHRIQLTIPFYLSESPVTQAQYRVMAEECLNELAASKGNRGVDPSNFRGNLRPVECVSWDDAQVVCRWLTRSGLLPLGWSADLPTEAQWEYACRAGTDTQYHSGDGEGALRAAGWFDGNSHGSTQEVKLKAPNGWGLYDMHGNVLEWCRDEWDGHAYCRRPSDVRDPEVLLGAADYRPRRVLRGGSWILPATYCRAAYRYWYHPVIRDRNDGFRVGLFPGPSCRDPAGER